MHDYSACELIRAARWTKATVYDDMWVDPDDDPREVDVDITDERDLLMDCVRSYRLTVEMKCAESGAEPLAQRSVPPSTMSLLGLVRHLAEDERHIRRVMAGEDAPKLYCTPENREGDWDDVIGDPSVVEGAWRQWRTEYGRVRVRSRLGLVECWRIGFRSGRCRRPAARHHDRPHRRVRAALRSCRPAP